MSITTYAELLTATGNWLADSTLSSRIPEFIVLTEQALNYGLDLPAVRIPPVRSRRMETRATASIDGEYETVPTDFLQAISLRLTGTEPITYLTYYPEADFNERWFASESGKPKFFTITGGNIRVGPTPDSGYNAELVYFASIPALTAVATTNWVITYHPDLYLYGNLLQAALFLENEAGMARWAPMFAGAVNGVNKATQRGRFVGPLQMRSQYNGG